MRRFDHTASFFFAGLPWGKRKRKTASYKGAHSKVSRPKKPGPKKSPKGKAFSPAVKLSKENADKEKSKRFTAKLVVALALGRGESMDAGMARMCLTIAMQLFEEADLKLDEDSRKIVGLRPVLGAIYARAPIGPSSLELAKAAQARGARVQGRAHVRGEGVEDYLDAALRA